ncbi:MAG TPA: GNAT family N-acetyltransferase [Nocardioidaceae bacterium]|nr:GNAT family N-acetyltransferase [Nocardioidaceae bacterium]
MSFDIERVDPMDLDLGTADAIAAADHASEEAAGLRLPPSTGPAVLTALQLNSDCRPVDALRVARDETGRAVGYVAVELPWRDNTDSAFLRGVVHPRARRHGLGSRLLGEALSFVATTGRPKVYAGAYEGSDGVPALAAMGFAPLDTRYAIRRLDVHAAPHGAWQRFYDEALPHAGDYDLVRQLGSTPEHRLASMVALHAAINDAPKDDPDMEEDVWDVDRVVSYEKAMAGRRQTLYRVMAVHRGTGDWAGQSLLCVDEFAPSVAFQEDTSVVRRHRGHRLGLLMKADMLRWLTDERPEIAAIDTWNATSNHHVIAVNERLGASVVGHHAGFRMLAASS